LLEQFSFFRGRLGWDHDLESNVQVPVPAAAALETLSAQTESLAILAARRDSQLDLAVQGLHGDPRAEHGFPRSDGQIRLQIVASNQGKSRMLLQPDMH
jgi:hypothetical protein